MSSSFTILISKDICMQNIFYLTSINWRSDKLFLEDKLYIYRKKNTILPLLSQYKITPIIPL